MELTLTETSAAVNSRRGTVTLFSGETRAFPITNKQWTSSLSLTSCRYEHCPYPDVLASEKWCSSIDFNTSKLLGQKHLWTPKSFNRIRLPRHFSQRIRTSLGTGSSQSTPSQHNSSRICFPRRRGATNPIGSYMELTVDKIPRRGFVL